MYLPGLCTKLVGTSSMPGYLSLTPPVFQGTHKSLKGNAHALATVTAIIDGTGSVGM